MGSVQDSQVNANRSSDGRTTPLPTAEVRPFPDRALSDWPGADGGFSGQRLERNEPRWRRGWVLCEPEGVRMES